MEVIKKFLEFELFNIGNYKLRIYNILILLLIFLATKILLWLIKKALSRRAKFKKLDAANTYALFQIIKYVLWVIAISLALESIGIEITVLIAGSAALLVGVGLGLQQTFNDVISGIILLSEKSIKINDILEIDGSRPCSGAKSAWALMSSSSGLSACGPISPADRQKTPLPRGT